MKLLLWLVFVAVLASVLDDFGVPQLSWLSIGLLVFLSFACWIVERRNRPAVVTELRVHWWNRPIEDGTYPAVKPMVEPHSPLPTLPPPGLARRQVK